VLTLNQSTGKITSKLAVNLMLAAFGEHLKIISTKWIPDTKTHIGVGT
jgi:hypothetical protein